MVNRYIIFQYNRLTFWKGPETRANMECSEFSKLWKALGSIGSLFAPDECGGIWLTLWLVSYCYLSVRFKPIWNYFRFLSGHQQVIAIDRLFMLSPLEATNHNVNRFPPHSSGAKSEPILSRAFQSFEITHCIPYLLEFPVLFKKSTDCIGIWYTGLPYSALALSRSFKSLFAVSAA